MLEKYYERYKDEIELIHSQNGVEPDLYPLIYLIITNIENCANISVRHIPTRRITTFSKNFIGEAGPSDYVIRTREKNNNAKVLGGIEAKYISRDLDLEKYTNQLSKHLKLYKRVIYTNGLIWRFYELDKYEEGRAFVWEVKLGGLNKGIIYWESDDKWQELLKKLDEIEW